MPAGWSRRVRVEQQKTACGQSGVNQAPTHVALLTVDPLDDGSGNSTPGTTEPSATNGYARQAIAYTAVSAPGSLDTQVIASNSGVITWVSGAGGAWSTGATNLTHIGFYNSALFTAVNEAAFHGRVPVSVPFPVNVPSASVVAGIGAIQIGCITS